MALDFQYDELMLRGSRLQNVQAGGVTYGWEFDMYYPSYRGTFVSCIEKLEITLDGKPVAVEDARFTLNGKQFLASELPELCHEHWFVLTPAKITVLGGGLGQGEHEIGVKLTHRVPYTGYFGQYLTLESVGTLKGAV